MRFFRAAMAAAFAFVAVPALAADFPAPKDGTFTLPEFKFHTGEVLKDVHLHYVTVGEPSGQPVLVLHGSGGSTASMLTQNFAGQLYGPGQPFDAAKYFIIIPDAIGHGKSTKPSDGLKTKFPHYDYADMVEGQYRLVTEGLGLKHLRLIIGNSMGGMQVWMWGEKHPDFMDALVPMASQPTAMASRNWIMRRMMLESIRNDPDYADGNYTHQPRAMKLAVAMFGFATSGGTLAYQAEAPTAAKADALIDARLKAPYTADANDFLYAWGSSHDYDAAPDLEKIEATVLAINAADDERNPPETGVTEAAVKRVKKGSIYLIPASAETRGHGTTGSAKWYVKQLQELLEKTPAGAM